MDYMYYAYEYDRGRIAVRSIAKHPYRFAGTANLSAARAHLATARDMHACNVSWYKVPGWKLACPADTIGQ